MKRSVSNWWRDWAKIDFIALGLGLLISLGYIAYRDKNPNVESPYLDLWSDLGMGLIGAWISIRLIDAVIGAREHQHSVRRQIWGNLNYIRQTSQQLLPRVYECDVVSLRHQLMWSKERLPNRTKYLYKSEIENLNDCLVQLEELVKLSEQHLENRQKTADARHQVDLTIERVNKIRNVLEHELNEIRYKGREKKNVLEPGFTSLIEQHKQALSTVELTKLKNFCQQLGATKDEDRLERLDELPYVREICFHQINLLSNFERLYSRLYEWKNYKIQDFMDKISEVKSTVSLGDFPEILDEHLSNYLSSIWNEANHYIKISKTVLKLIEVIDRTRFDLTEESEID